MKNFFQTLLILFMTIQVKAQSNEIIYLWPNDVPNEINEKQVSTFVVDSKRNNEVRITQVSNPSLEVFLPKNPNSSGAGILVCPGGGYNILAINKEGNEIAEWLNELGYTAFVLQYRVPKNEIGALNDMQRAMKIVRSKATEYNLNTERIGAIGFSAGGSLTARASALFSTNSYEAIDEVDALSSRPDFSMLIYPAYLDLGDDRALTPELEIQENTPPFFIFGTADDAYGNSSLVFAGALRDHKIPVDLHFLSTGGHGYGMRSGNIAGETWPDLAESWLANLFVEE